MNVLTRNTVLVQSDDVTVEEFDDGVVIWDPQGGRLHNLDLPGRELWRLVDGRRPLAEVFDQAALRFGVTADVIRKDAMPFLADLLTKGLLSERN